MHLSVTYLWGGLSVNNMLLISIPDRLYIYFNFEALSLPVCFARTLPLFLFSPPSSLPLQALLGLCRCVGIMDFFLFFIFFLNCVTGSLV